MPLRELDAKASIAKYGVLIPNVTTLKKMYEEGGSQRALILVIDKSGSMKGLIRIERAIEASVGLVEQVRRSGDLVSAIAFDTFPWLTSPPSRNYTEIINKICGLIADGSTSISRVPEMALEQRLSRHATFIITDYV